MIKGLVCRVCRSSGAESEPIAFFDSEMIQMPLVTGMFEPINDESPFPPYDPDLPDIEWFYMRCPLCGGSPFGLPELSEEELHSLEQMEVQTVAGSCIVQTPKVIKVEVIENESVSRKRGRPKGSKNK